MVGFVEVSETSGSKYGMGSGVPIADTRPVVSNLAVDPLARRFGIGTALMDACEDLVKTWQFDEIILQVVKRSARALTSPSVERGRIVVETVQAFWERR